MDRTPENARPDSSPEHWKAESGTSRCRGIRSKIAIIAVRVRIAAISGAISPVAAVNRTAENSGPYDSPGKTTHINQRDGTGRRTRNGGAATALGGSPDHTAADAAPSPAEPRRRRAD
ncbi:hypothetical protein GCM10023196_047170 [Actinoallomurus vinaceus]|uniref:Uncharacterized protein n=1 Tax=Actinoallomurus vinaceus TaxID=1080074 RepID=A0ABP8UEX1_9ACTN